MNSENLFFKKSSFVAFLIVVAFIFFHFYLPKYDVRGAHNELSWDILSYYLYLPLSFIHGDIGINDPNYIQHIFDQYHFSPAFYQAAQAKNGNWVMIYTMGMAILYAPFFLIGHLWAIHSGYPADGFSYPYQFCVSSGMLLYTAVGVYFFRKILLHFFNDRITSFVLIIILIGTNFYREAVDYNMGPHAVLFSFYCVLIYYTIRWHAEQKKRYVVFIGFSMGFLTLIRPTEAICIFIPLLWNIKDKVSFYEKIDLVKKHLSHFFILVAVVFLVGLPQFLYWKHQTGSFLYNSYWNQNSFDISESHFTKVFFSIRKGWLVYTPVIILAFAGFFYLKNDTLKKARLAIIIFISLNIFILTHVPVWFNAGSFGQRFMVQSYAILAIPMGAFLESFINKSFLKKFVLTLFCFLTLALNLFQTWQFVWWILPGDGITWEYYKRSFLKTSGVTEEDRGYLELQRSYDPNEKFDINNPSYKKQFVSYFDMDNFNTEAITGNLSKDFALSGVFSNKIDSLGQYSVGIFKPFSSITKKDHAWIQVTIWLYSRYDLKENPVDIVICMDHNKKAYGYWNYKLDDFPFKRNQWNKYTIQYLTPLLQGTDDAVSSYVWYRGHKEAYIDNVYYEAYVKK